MHALYTQRIHIQCENNKRKKNWTFLGLCRRPASICCCRYFAIWSIVNDFNGTQNCFVVWQKARFYHICANSHKWSVKFYSKNKWISHNQPLTLGIGIYIYICTRINEWTSLVPYIYCLNGISKGEQCMAELYAFQWSRDHVQLVKAFLWSRNLLISVEIGAKGFRKRTQWAKRKKRNRCLRAKTMPFWVKWKTIYSCDRIAIRSFVCCYLPEKKITENKILLSMWN